MMLKSRMAILVAAIALSGCAAMGPAETPQTTVFAAKSGYDTALTAAVAYKRLPACREPKVLPCSDPKLLDQIRKADNVANSALDAAENAVRNPGFGKNIAATAAAAASAALRAFVEITATLGAK